MNNGAAPPPALSPLAPSPSDAIEQQQYHHHHDQHQGHHQNQQHDSSGNAAIGTLVPSAPALALAPTPAVAVTPAPAPAPSVPGPSVPAPPPPAAAAAAAAAAPKMGAGGAIPAVTAHFGLDSISAAAQQYQEAISKYRPQQQEQEQEQEQPPPPPPPQPPASNSSAQALPPLQSTNSPSDLLPTAKEVKIEKEETMSRGNLTTPHARPSRTSTPARSNAAETPAIPSLPVEHGAPFRSYLNLKVVPTLLEGLKQLAVERPNDPLRALGEFLLQKSRETES